MIFVTVGTHEQPFDRLVKELDRLVEEGVIEEDVFIQTGYSTYVPQFCTHEAFISFDDMIQKIGKARIVITHGGPGSIMFVLYQGKIPVVVPRQKAFSEHVDDHQVRFIQTLEKGNRVIAVYDISKLENVLKNYSEMAAPLGQAEKGDLGKKTKDFAAKLDELCHKLVASDQGKG
jgi:UDP-N-acetylglucosamine transferase subunit ALG13